MTIVVTIIIPVIEIGFAVALMVLLSFTLS